MDDSMKPIANHTARTSMIS